MVVMVVGRRVVGVMSFRFFSGPTVAAGSPGSFTPSIQGPRIALSLWILTPDLVRDIKGEIRGMRSEILRLSSS